MATRERMTQITSEDFEAFVSEVAAEIWNQLIQTAKFHTLRPEDYPALYEIISGVLIRYRIERMVLKGGRL